VEARARRFSEGIERMSLAPSSSRVGCFGDGAEGPRSDSAKRTGTFADGLAHQPHAASAARIGNFSDGLARLDRDEADEGRHVESRIAA
jgi:hypothetical protein